MLTCQTNGEDFMASPSMEETTSSRLTSSLKDMNRILLNVCGLRSLNLQGAKGPIIDGLMIEGKNLGARTSLINGNDKELKGPSFEAG